MNVKNVVIGVIILLLGVFCAVGAWREWSAYRLGAGEPQEMTLRQLVERGPEGPSHLRLTDFAFIYRPAGADKLHLAFVAQGKSGADEWAAVLIPLGPKPEANPGGPKPPAGDPAKVLLRSTHLLHQSDLDSFIASKPKQFDVVVVPYTLTEKQREALSGEVPNNNFADAIVVEEGYDHGITMPLAFTLAGVLFLVVGGFVLLSGLRGEGA
jgi:hypothetical protein